MMKAVLFVSGLTAVCLATSSSLMSEVQAGSPRSVLPSSDNAKALLSATTRHREWVTIGAGAGATLAFVVYPERADRAPAILVTARGESASVQARATGDQLAAEGFISIIPDATGAA